MIYLVNSNKYSFSYRELKEKYLEICSLSLDSFLAKLPEVLHLVCMISFLKEIPNQHLVGDESLIHNIAHLMHLKDEPLILAEKIKEQFKIEMELC